ncbi:MAG: hypothetical protein ACHQ16_02965 [Candidatus Lutacidiplasmatales archaeon]
MAVSRPWPRSIGIAFAVLTLVGALALALIEIARLAALRGYALFYSVPPGPEGALLILSVLGCLGATFYSLSKSRLGFFD